MKVSLNTHLKNYWWNGRPPAFLVWYYQKISQHITNEYKQCWDKGHQLENQYWLEQEKGSCVTESLAGSSPLHKFASPLSTKTGSVILDTKNALIILRQS